MAETIDVGRVRAIYEANVKGFITELEKAAKASDQFKKRAVKDAGDASNALSRMGTSSSQASTAFGLLKAAIVGIGVQRLSADLIALGDRMGKLSANMRASTGSSVTANRTMSEMADLADRLGENVLPLQEAFSRLSLAAKGTALEGQGIKDVFIGIAEAGTVMNISTEEMTNVVEALRIAMQRGEIDSRVFVRTIGSTFPQAANLLSKELGITQEALLEMIKTGQLSATEMLPALGRAFRKEFSEQVPQAAKDADGALSRLNNSLIRIKQEIIQGGFLQGMAEGLDAFAIALSSPAVQEGLRNLGSMLGNLVSLAGRNADTLLALTAAFGGAWAGAKALSIVPLPPQLKAIVIGLGAGAAGLYAYTTATETTRTEVEKLAKEIETLEQNLKEFEKSGSAHGKAMADRVREDLAARRSQARAALGIDDSDRAKRGGADMRVPTIGAASGGIPMPDNIKSIVDGLKTQIAALRSTSEQAAVLAALQQANITSGSRWSGTISQLATEFHYLKAGIEATTMEATRLQKEVEGSDAHVMRMRENRKMQTELNKSASSLGDIDREIARQKELNAAYSGARLEIMAQLRFLEMRNKLIDEGIHLGDKELEQLRDKADKLVELSEAQQEAERRSNLHRDSVHNLKKAFQDAADFGATSLTNALVDLSDQTKQTGDTLREFFMSLQRMIASTIIQKTVSEPISNFIGDFAGDLLGGIDFGSLFGGGGGSVFSGGHAGRFAGEFATGGRIGAGEWGIAGEKGPEAVVGPAFVMPNAGGFAARMGEGGRSSGGGTTVAVTNNFQVGVQGTVRAELEKMLPSIEKRTTTSVFRAINRGGSEAIAVGRRQKTL